MCVTHRMCEGLILRYSSRRWLVYECFLSREVKPNLSLSFFHMCQAPDYCNFTRSWATCSCVSNPHDSIFVSEHNRLVSLVDICLWTFYLRSCRKGFMSRYLISVVAAPSNVISLRVLLFRWSRVEVDTCAWFPRFRSNTDTVQTKTESISLKFTTISRLFNSFAYSKFVIEH